MAPTEVLGYNDRRGLRMVEISETVVGAKLSFCGAVPVRSILVFSTWRELVQAPRAADMLLGEYVQCACQWHQAAVKGHFSCRVGLGSNGLRMGQSRPSISSPAPVAQCDVDGC